MKMLFPPWLASFAVRWGSQLTPAFQTIPIEFRPELCWLLIAPPGAVDLPPDFGATQNLVESVFRAGDGNEEAVHRGADPRFPQTGGGWPGAGVTSPRSPWRGEWGPPCRWQPRCLSIAYAGTVLVDQLPEHKVLSLGVISGRNIWKTDLIGVLNWLEPVAKRLGLRLAT